jgi:hypothetical protein
MPLGWHLVEMCWMTTAIVPERAASSAAPAQRIDRPRGMRPRCYEPAEHGAVGVVRQRVRCAPENQLGKLVAAASTDDHQLGVLVDGALVERRGGEPVTTSTRYGIPRAPSGSVHSSRALRRDARTASIGGCSAAMAAAPS